MPHFWASTRYPEPWSPSRLRPKPGVGSESRRPCRLGLQPHFGAAGPVPRCRQRLLPTRLVGEAPSGPHLTRSDLQRASADAGPVGSSCPGRWPWRHWSSGFSPRHGVRPTGTRPSTRRPSTISTSPMASPSRPATGSTSRRVGRSTRHRSAAPSTAWSSWPPWHPPSAVGPDRGRRSRPGRAVGGTGRRRGGGRLTVRLVQRFDRGHLLVRHGGRSLLIILAWRARPGSWHGVGAVVALGLLAGFRQSDPHGLRPPRPAGRDRLHPSLEPPRAHRRWPAWPPSLSGSSRWCSPSPGASPPGCTPPAPRRPARPPSPRCSTTRRARRPTSAPSPPTPSVALAPLAGVPVLAGIVLLIRDRRRRRPCERRGRVPDRSRHPVPPSARRLDTAVVPVPDRHPGRRNRPARPGRDPAPVRQERLPARLPARRGDRPAAPHGRPQPASAGQRTGPLRSGLTVTSVASWA